MIVIFDFGNRLKELRLQKKLTQTQVAKRLNLSKSTISGYENNLKMPSLDVLIHLAMFYGVTTDYILGLQDKKSIFIEGLTDRQQEILTILLMEFKSKK